MATMMDIEVMWRRVRRLRVRFGKEDCGFGLLVYLTLSLIEGVLGDRAEGKVKRRGRKTLELGE
jgi:hypothetical protein